jgi:hypothetical protein
MKLYHRTTVGNAEKILSGGFVDREGKYMTNLTHRGVWLSDRPLDGETVDFDTLLEVDLCLSIAHLTEYEWANQGYPYREFLIPASIVNAKGKMRLISFDEEDALDKTQPWNRRRRRRCWPKRGYWQSRTLKESRGA